MHSSVERKNAGVFADLVQLRYENRHTSPLSLTLSPKKLAAMAQQGVPEFIIGKLAQETGANFGQAASVEKQETSPLILLKKESPV
jgi:hypothetical protein